MKTPPCGQRSCSPVLCSGCGRELSLQLLLLDFMASQGFRPRCSLRAFDLQCQLEEFRWPENLSWTSAAGIRQSRSCELHRLSIPVPCVTRHLTYFEGKLPAMSLRPRAQLASQRPVPKRQGRQPGALASSPPDTAILSLRGSSWSSWSSELLELCCLPCEGRKRVTPGLCGEGLPRWSFV